MRKQSLSPDLVIVGAGVAACATAIAVRNKLPELSITLVDRIDKLGDTNATQTWPRMNETLPGHAAVPLQKLGLWQSFRACGFTPSHGSSAVWGSDGMYFNEFVLSPYGNGWIIDRVLFDDWLRKEAKMRGIETIQSTGLIHCSEKRQMVKMEFRDDLNIDARFVVDASGRSSSLATKFGAVSKRADRLIALYRVFKAANNTSTGNCSTLVESQDHGWWYSAHINHEYLIAAFLTDSDIAKTKGLRKCEAWEACLRNSKYTKHQTNQAIDASPINIISAHTRSLNRFSGQPWLAVGDAAYCFDPLSSLGLFKALRMSNYAAYAITDYFSGHPVGLKKYHHLAASEFHAYLTKRRAYYSQETRYSQSTFWKRRQGKEVV